MHRAVRVGSAVLAVAVFLTVLTIGTGAAEAATSRPSGHFTSAFQHRDGSVRVRGVAFDAAHPHSRTTVCVVVARSCVRSAVASGTSRHRFTVRIPRQRPGVWLNLRTRSGTHLDRIHVRTPGARVLAIAKRYRHSRYVEGGSSPRTGFDCSGYVKYAYHRAHVADLPHNTDQQLRARHMHRISRRHALPGDLIFYFSGGSSTYHVAIYAGHGMQYAAATPSDGVRYQPIWSSDIAFATDWH